MILSLQKNFSFITGISEEAFHFQKLLQVTRILDFQLFAFSYSCLWAECIAHQGHCRRFDRHPMLQLSLNM